MNSDEFGWSEFGKLQNRIWQAVYRWRMESGLMALFYHQFLGFPNFCEASLLRVMCQMSNLKMIAPLPIPMPSMLKNWEESAMPHATIFEQKVSFKQRKNTQAVGNMAVGNMWQKWRSSLLLQHMVQIMKEGKNKRSVVKFWGFGESKQNFQDKDSSERLYSCHEASAWWV